MQQEVHEDKDMQEAQFEPEKEAEAKMPDFHNPFENRGLI
ncbi:hypothetical protein L195_g031129 [Trifolium pratense]|uniref:Uncharacterized protein n=1 Tax=Trifolium pratense TaxID=57577 RepID=A0A2K3L9J0_TRIPR|nr:hypothetical protein L195_g031129 [Trifolium pratense]